MRSHHNREDDGGSAKDGYRNTKRKLRKLGTISFLTSLFMFFGVVCYINDDLTDTGSGRNDNYDGESNDTRKYRWSDPRMLPPIPGDENAENEVQDILLEALSKISKRNAEEKSIFKQMKRTSEMRKSETDMSWEAEADYYDREKHKGPSVDFTALKYLYPDTMDKPPSAGQYPVLETLSSILYRWPQDDIDHPPNPFQETLMHFDYSDSKQMEAAKRFRDMEIPFKVYNVPELKEAGLKWTDDYVSKHFDGWHTNSHGHCQESVDNFFAFFKNQNWDVKLMGPPPTLKTPLNFAQWSKHARYADQVGLAPHKTHYYWQSGAPKGERFEEKSKWSFISKDLPSFSNPKPTFFGFAPENEKGIQCRFGERGVVAATHYDDGRNMVAMITGAKRYILAPPNQCTKLGMVTDKRHPVYRHSLLNFGHMNLLNKDNLKETMPIEERRWLERASDSLAIDTVLKAGEVLYIPSFWFHYIISLQKSAQCNTRSGTSEHTEFSDVLGGHSEVKTCVGESNE